MNVGISVTLGVDALDRVDVELLADIGLSAVFVVCYEDEVRWYVEDLAGFCRAVEAVGLEAYAMPYGYGKFMDPDPSVESLYVQTHPQTCQVDCRGRRLAKACPNNPQFLEWFSSSMRTLAWLVECRGFLWDEPGFHYTSRGQWSCRCDYCQRLFHATYGKQMPRELTDEVLQFRANSVSMFVLAAAAAIESVDRRLSSLVMPPPRSGPGMWQGSPGVIEAIARCSCVDALCALAPWQQVEAGMEDTIRRAVEGIGKSAGKYDKGMVLWLPASPSPEDRLLESIEVAGGLGVDAVVLADYYTLLETPEFAYVRDDIGKLLAEVSEISTEG